MSESSPTKTNFVRDIIDEHNRTGRFDGKVHTRFPPEPNGYLHIGHAKSICLNFGIAEDYGGLTNLRFDDTNPVKEDVEYVDSIKDTIHWLGFDWQDREYYASDYFEILYQNAVKLVEKGKAYVCDLSADEVRDYRGTLTEPGKESPYRDRSVAENLDLFTRMRAGEFPDGARTLRAKIDMNSPNLNLRDPIMYRILHSEHHRTGNQWCIYPMYDYAHCVSDSVEKITHSICTLEFEDHRPLYDWFLDELELFHPQQIEFARLNLTYTIMSKRKLLRLVQEKYVSGWDDPRMPTLAGMRRRGYTPSAIRNFSEVVGVAKNNSIVDMELLEHVLRDDLNQNSKRRMAVLRPLKVVIDNYPEEQIEVFEILDFPQDPECKSSRKVPFSRELYIEQDDFMETPPPKYFRLAPGQEVRLMNAYYVTCTSVKKNADGKVVEVHCSYDSESRGGMSSDGRKVKGTIHWVSAAQAVEAEVRLYTNLFNKKNPYEVEEGGDFTDNLNPDSLEILVPSKLEPDLANAKIGESFQFMRNGYFCLDSEDSRAGQLIFNRTISLVDSWAKLQK
ncbi:MAG: glutamine--tRNA ligase/YqeY domain fusion protein [Anaerolineaceae bacterium]